MLILHTSDSGIKSGNMLNQKIAEELHKPIIRKFKKRKMDSPFSRFSRYAINN